MDDPLKSLRGIPNGQYPCRKWYQFWKRGGWLTVEQKPDYTSVMWTTSRDTHNPLCGPATCVDVRPDGSLYMYCESVIRMWIKWGLGRGDDSDLQRGIREAIWMAEVLGGAR